MTFEKRLTERFKRIAALLPLALLVGILTQLIELAKYDAFMLFSWGQVINDTVFLCVPFTVIAAWVYAGSTDSEYRASGGKMVGRYFLTLGGGFVLALLTLFASLALPPLRSLGLMPFWLLLMYMVGLLYYHVFHGTKAEPASLNARNFWRPLAYFACTLLLFAGLFLGLDNFYSYFSRKVYLQTEKWAEEKVQYMNDKYIIYGTGRVVSNNGGQTILIKQ